MTDLRLIFTTLLFLPLVACLDDSDDDDDTQSVTDISNTTLSKRSGDCSDYVGKYESNVTDVKRGIGFMGDITITATDTDCTINSNDIPNHDFNDANASFATNVAEVDKSFTIPINPSKSSSNTELALGVVNVVLLNGVVVDILPAACYGEGNGQTLGEEKIGCEGDQINNPWRYDPMSSLNSFGTDSHNAHVQPDGTYHYHGNPVALFAQNCSSESNASAVIGFAADGFPVYGSCIDDGNSGIRQVTSSYQLKTGARQAVSPYSTPVNGQGNIDSANYDGQFRGDYEYSASLGDLDECNGMTVDGQYGYYVSNTFPWIVNCYKGTVQESFKPANQQAMEIKMHGHDHN